MKIRIFFLSVFFTAVFAVFFACSFDGAEGFEGISERFQIYSGSSKYDGGGVIRMELRNKRSNLDEYIEVGTVTNGIGTLNLYSIVYSDYLYDLRGEYHNSVDVNPEDTKIAEAIFYVINGNDAFQLKAESENGMEFLSYKYFSQAATVIGEETYGLEFLQYDINASKGWNAEYKSCVVTAANYACQVSTDSSTIKLRQIKWYVEYKGNSSNYGGSDKKPSSSSSKPSSSSFGGNTSGNWCVDHDWEECTNDPDYLSSPQDCADWSGVLQDDCPAGYAKNP